MCLHEDMEEEEQQTKRYLYSPCKDVYVTFLQMLID